ncbi:cyclophilin 1 long isoform [Alternaria alternata]|nr:cyclophilin 1 long isoform [Alternaria alternata]
MPHLPRASALSAFRAAPQLRAPINKRFFTPSAYNMAIKAYFDCSWTGPTVEVDNAGNVTSQGEVKGSYDRFHMRLPPADYELQRNPVASTSSSSTMSFPRRLRTSAPSAPARRVLATRAQSSTA